MRIHISFPLCLDTANNLLTGGIANVDSVKNSKFNCIFLSGFTGSSRCQVQYGIDATFVDLPYSAVSTETGTAGDTVSVVLRERLNSSTMYYYNVSAVNRCLTVTVQGIFTTPQYSTCSMHLYERNKHTLYTCMNILVCMITQQIVPWKSYGTLRLLMLPLCLMLVYWKLTLSIKIVVPEMLEVLH